MLPGLPPTIEWQVPLAQVAKLSTVAIPQATVRKVRQMAIAMQASLQEMEDWALALQPL